MRNSTIDICKGLAIIAMVVGHADSPSHVVGFVYLWHMPLFFITAGYFFSKKYLSDEATFVKKRFKSLYWPMVKWTIICILLNPLFFATGILNEQYGNTDGGVTHPLNFHQAMQHIVDCVTTMGGYDVFLLSAFWFFRALLVGSILFLVLFKLFSHIPWVKKYDEAIIALICALMFSCALLKYGEGIRFHNINQGGFREMMCVFFMGLGFLFRKYEERWNRVGWIGYLLIIPLLFFTYHWTASLSLNTKYEQVFRIPVVATVGFLFVYTIAKLISKYETPLKTYLAYAGKQSLQVMIFHIFAFKLVCMAHVLIAGLEWNQIGCHMVVHSPATTQWIWIIYSIVGVNIPLLGIFYYDKIKERIYRKVINN